MSLNIYLKEKNKLKRVLSLVLVGVMAIGLFACGGGKVIERTGNEALGM